MATYVIGDVQGCYTELRQLLTLINFNERQDRLGFVGDLVNRGPNSLEVLRFVKSLPEPIVVLGNHDFHLLALGYGAVAYSGDHTLDDVLQAPDLHELLFWLRHQPLLHYEASFDAILVHAGIPPQWRLTQASACAVKVSEQLRGVNFLEFLQQIYHDQPVHREVDLNGWDRLRYIVDAFTRLRFCTRDGQLDLMNKSAHSTDPENWRPWFEWYQLSHQVVYGHWAALEGYSSNPRCVALDTGCVWGNRLTAYRLEDQRLFSVPAVQAQPL